VCRLGERAAASGAAALGSQPAPGVGKRYSPRQCVLDRPLSGAAGGAFWWRFQGSARRQLAGRQDAPGSKISPKARAKHGQGEIARCRRPRERRPGKRSRVAEKGGRAGPSEVGPGGSLGRPEPAGATSGRLSCRSPRGGAASGADGCNEAAPANRQCSLTSPARSVAFGRYGCEIPL
jgi:hypothetical protein